MHRIYRISGLAGFYATVALLVCSKVVLAASGVVEIDLLFPQNDTYEPTPIIPVAFAFQKSELTGYLQPKVSFSIFPYQNYSADVIARGVFDMTWTNFSNSTDYIQYGEAIEGLNTEGIWTLEWLVETSNCSNPDKLEFSLEGFRHHMTFSTKNGAKKPDLTAATSEGTCSKSNGMTYQITETYDSGTVFDNKLPCPVVAETTPAPDPCAVHIDASAAANASASLTSRWCSLETSTWCPQPDKGAAPRMMGPSLAVSGIVLFAASIGGMGFLMV